MEAELDISKPLGLSYTRPGVHLPVVSAVGAANAQLNTCNKDRYTAIEACSFLCQHLQKQRTSELNEETR